MSYSDCLFFSTNILARNLTRMAEEAFQETGLAPSYAFLVMAVNDSPGIRPSDLSKKLELTPSTITRLIEKMEYQGYLTRTTNGRSTHVELTKEGETLNERVHILWEEFKTDYADVLGTRYSSVLTEMVNTANEKLHGSAEKD